ncbi:hypothetical protein L596_027583 [Steinernema carpocapsae]|uniref:Uncharacterized protein n=1 Tax=Steinernema carpocapsae TaxID=34508 RepID=A0A4U5LVX9_STECR|nr:hypothetical protein L596_027583 [Steinernema carpocapsae]
MTETVPNPPAAAVSTSAAHSAAWLESESNTLRLSGASTSTRHPNVVSVGHLRHMNHHHANSAAPRYQQSIHVDGENEVMESVYSSSSSRTNSSYQIHDTSLNDSDVSPPRRRISHSSAAAQLTAKHWTQFEDSEEYGSGSDDESNEDTDDGHTVDDYDDGSDKPHNCCITAHNSAGYVERHRNAESARGRRRWR